MNNSMEGLSTTEVLSRKKQFGENILQEKKSLPLLFIFLRQFKSPLVYTLVLATIISLGFGRYSDFWIIFVVIVVNSLIGAYQEYTAENTFLALRKMLIPKTLVIRDGKRLEIAASELVPNDLVVLTAGDQVPADGLLLRSSNMVVDEKIFTGEDEPVAKDESRKKDLFMGTKVLAGTGIMEVKKIGTQTEIGKISQTLTSIKKEETPLQKRLARFSQKLIIIVAIVAVLIFVFSLFRHQEIWTAFEFSLILAVAAIPEGIPIVTTVIMTLGMKRILKKNGLVKNLLSVETLGSTSVICTDKTGTLTEGVMEVVKTDFSDKENAYLAMVLSNQQKDGLEISLWSYVDSNSRTSAKDLVSSFDKTFEEPFDSQKKYSMAIVKNSAKKETGYILGAPEIVLGFCQLSEEEKENEKIKIENWAKEGLKVVGVIYKNNGKIKNKKGWKWLGIIGIDDPIREEVKETIALCRKAGIAVKIVTGDFRQTAIEVGRKLGFSLNDENVMDSQDLLAISTDELAKKVGQIEIFARITPDQKLKIVESLQKNREVVAMTGDGVNDVLALKKADIAIVVSSATDVAKESADLILLDDNFKTIYTACEEGRTILTNIKKAVGYALSDSFVEMVVIFIATLLNFPLPITIVMILWINLICDGPNDILLGFETKEAGIMSLSPKTIQKESIFDNLILSITIVISSTVGIVSLFYFWYIQKIGGDLILARTIVFASIAFASLIYIFTFKNLKKTLIEIRNFSENKYLYFGVAFGFILILAAIYLPKLNNILETTPLSFAHWMLVIAVGIISLFFVELLKIANRKNWAFFGKRD